MSSARRRRRLSSSAAWGCAALMVALSSWSRLAAQDVPPDRLVIPDAFNDAAHGETIPIERAVRFAVRGDDLAVSSALTIADGAQQVRLAGLEGNTKVQVVRRSRGPTRMVPYFELDHTGAARRDGTGSARTVITAEGDGVRITRTIRIGELTTVVTFTQGRISGRSAVAPADERVTLRVRSAQLTTPPNVAPADVRVSAASFTQLLRNHPGEAAVHLAPIFRDFGQEATVFRIDARLAWQLFPNAVEVDEATRSKVLELVDELGADEFRKRELATAELEVIGGPALLILREMERESLAAEQSARIDAILLRYSELDEAEVAALLGNTEFLMRCFAHSDLPPIRAAAARALAEKLGIPVKLNPSDRPPARVRAIEALRKRLPAEP